MRADGSDEHSGNFGMDERAAGGEGVRGGAGWGGHGKTIGLDSRHVVFVA